MWLLGHTPTRLFPTFTVMGPVEAAPEYRVIVDANNLTVEIENELSEYGRAGRSDPTWCPWVRDRQHPQPPSLLAFPRVLPPIPFC